MREALLIVGAGGHARVIADAAAVSSQWSRIAFLDDIYPEITRAGRWDIVGRIDDLASLVGSYGAAFIGIGNCRRRLELQVKTESLGFHLPVIRHPASVIAEDVSIGGGTVVLAGAVVNTATRIGKACIINTNATIEHDCVLADAVHVCPGARLAGGVEVGEAGWIGLGASVIQKLRIGNDVTVGAGAAVLSDVASKATVAGVPARVIKESQ